MRSLRSITAAALLLVAGTAFVQAGRCAQELRARAGATARAHTYAWRDLHAPIPPPPVLDVAPAALEEEEAEQVAEQLAEAPLPPPVKRVRKVHAPVAVAPAPRLEVEPEDAVRLALRGKRASFERCYEVELKKQAAFSGFVVISVSVSADGRVLNSHVEEGNRRDAAVGACIAAAVRTLKLPALTSDADLLIPIRLEAKEPT